MSEFNDFFNTVRDGYNQGTSEYEADPRNPLLILKAIVGSLSLVQSYCKSVAFRYFTTFLSYGACLLPSSATGCAIYTFRSSIRMHPQLRALSV